MFRAGDMMKRHPKPAERPETPRSVGVRVVDGRSAEVWWSADQASPVTLQYMGRPTRHDLVCLEYDTSLTSNLLKIFFMCGFIFYCPLYVCPV